MRQQISLGVLLLCMGISICQGASREILFFAAEELEAGIATHSLDFDFFLIDLRDDWELQNGIIATRYCRPYHLSWFYNVLQEKYRLLPDTMRILLYCQTGNRAIDAANFLADKGYKLIGCLTEGVRGYGGELHDSLECKPLSLLPEPSYFRDTTAAVTSDHRSLFIAPRSDGNRLVFTLQGRLLGQSIERKNAAAVVVFRRDGGTMPMLRAITR
jgi:rhodanese-related sulfurtransferase